MFSVELTDTVWTFLLVTKCHRFIERDYFLDWERCSGCEHWGVAVKSRREYQTVKHTRSVKHTCSVMGGEKKVFLNHITKNK